MERHFDQQHDLHTGGHRLYIADYLQYYIGTGVMVFAAGAGAARGAYGGRARGISDARAAADMQKL